MFRASLNLFIYFLGGPADEEVLDIQAWWTDKLSQSDSRIWNNYE